jgi:hypothetical protein
VKLTVADRGRAFAANTKLRLVADALAATNAVKELNTLPLAVDTSTEPTEVPTLHVATQAAADFVDTTPLTVNLSDVTNFDPLATELPLIAITAASACTTFRRIDAVAERVSLVTTHVMLFNEAAASNEAE